MEITFICFERTELSGTPDFSLLPLTRTSSLPPLCSQLPARPSMSSFPPNLESGKISFVVAFLILAVVLHALLTSESTLCLPGPRWGSRPGSLVRGRGHGTLLTNEI